MKAQTLGRVDTGIPMENLFGRKMTQCMYTDNDDRKNVNTAVFAGT